MSKTLGTLSPTGAADKIMGMGEAELRLLAREVFLLVRDRERVAIYDDDSHFYFCVFCAERGPDEEGIPHAPSCSFRRVRALLDVRPHGEEGL